jgi:hypothetical protein
VRFRARVEESEGGDYLASCAEPAAEGRGLSPMSALERLRAELRYQVELCPCSGVDDDAIQLDLEG